MARLEPREQLREREILNQWARSSRLRIDKFGLPRFDFWAEE